MPDVPVLNLSGTPFERGLTHGEALRDTIRAFSEEVITVHQANNALLRVDREPLAAFCLKNQGFLEKFAPDLVQEMRGLAQGAGLGYADILLLNSFLELEDLRAPGLGARILPDSLWGCTTFNVRPEASAQGRALLGQTYDMERSYEKYLCLLRIQPEKGPTQLLISFAGVLGLCGLNSAGIGAVINKVAATDARPGVIYPMVMRRALASERIGDALGAVIFSPRATGMTYQLSCPDAAFCAETSASAYQLLEFDAVLAHTNHFVGDGMRRFEVAHWLSHGGSMVRKQVADRFLKQNAGSLTPALLQELSRNHVNHPRCICAHGFPGEDDRTAFHTTFAVIMDPAGGWFDFCPGNPCQNGYARHPVQA
jgi:isopenicillin-N N-acyltransferase-like protein